MDSCAIHIGNNIDKEACAAFISSIESLFDSAYRNRMEQETVRCAIEAFSQAFNVEGTCISNCTITTRG